MIFPCIQVLKFSKTKNTLIEFKNEREEGGGGSIDHLGGPCKKDTGMQGQHLVMEAEVRGCAGWL